MADHKNPTSVHDLADCEYVLLTTYTHDGRAKPTPVWAARDGDALVAVSDAEAWKVRRITGEPRVTLAACDMRGDLRGGAVDGVAVVVDGTLVQRVEAALRRKYGWKMALLDLTARLRPRRPRVGLVVRDVARGR